MNKLLCSLAVALLAACGGGGSSAPADDGSGNPVTPPPVQTDERANVRGLSCSGPDGSGWCWQLPQPGPQVLGEMQFIDAQRGLAVGSGGLVVRTVDGGRTWQRTAQLGTETLHGLRVDGQGRGWAWNLAGEMHQTVDGGEHWLPHPRSGLPFERTWMLPDGRLLISTGAVDPSGGEPAAGCSRAPLALASVPAQRGWDALALAPLLVTQTAGDAPTLHGVAGPCGERWGRSTDGGRSFEPQNGVDASLRLLALGDGGQGLWAVVARPVFGPDGSLERWTAAQLLRSRDDGRSWGEAVELPAAAPYPGLVLRDGVGALLPAAVPQRSLDGGRTWQPLPLPDGAGGAGGADSTVLHDRNWLLVPMPDGSARVSSDLGRSWSATPTLPSVPTRLLAQDDGSLAWMSADLRLRRSTDGGRSWNTVPFGPAAPAIAELLFFDAREGLALTLEGALFASSDGGRHWEPRSPQLRLRGLHAAADGGAWALEGERLMRTSDRGRSWTALALPDEVAAAGRLADARWVDARSAWLRTERRTCIVALRPFCFAETTHLFVTEDGGARWTLRATTERGEVDRAVALAADGRMLRITWDGRVLRSANAGRDWEAVPPFDVSFASNSPRGIVQLGSAHVWLLGDERIWRSTDGGRTWQGGPAPRVSGDRPLSPGAMAFADPLRGWLVGSGTLVMATDDGGASWQLQPTDVGLGLYAVFALDAQRVWLGGAEGILATATGGR